MISAGVMESGQLKSFVSETEIEDGRKRRQEEWEKVRKPNQPESKRQSRPTSNIEVIYM